MTGAVVVVPTLLTLYVLKLAVEFFAGFTTPVARALLVTDATVSPLAVDAAVALVAVVLTAVVGFLARYSTGRRVIERVDRAAMRVPLVGTVYEGARRMGDAVLAEEARPFRSVKLIELPADTSDTVVRNDVPAIARPGSAIIGNGRRTTV